MSAVEPSSTYPKYKELRVVRGDSWRRWKVRWTDSEDNVIVIEAARLEIRRWVNATEPIVSLTLDEGIEVDGDGYLWPVMTPEQTAELTDGVFDFELTAESGQVRTIVAGPVVLIEDVSRD